MSNSNSNVIKLAANKKKPDIEEWKAEIMEHGEKLMDRLYDAIRLADDETNDNDIPEEYSDCMIIGVLTSVLVKVTNARNVLSPNSLRELVNYEIEERED